MDVIPDGEPLPPSTVNKTNDASGNGANSSTPTKAKNDNKKKKTLLVAAIGIAICVAAAIGFGVGFGMQKNMSTDIGKGSSGSTNIGDNSDIDGLASDNDVDAHQYDAVIIGAGWAGIHATQTLMNAGITNILVLESSNYIGGRSKSYNPKDGSYNNPDLINDMYNVPYDLGSEWLYPRTGQGDYLAKGGYLNDASLNSIEEDKTVLPMKSGQFYQQTRDEATGELTATVLEDADEWIDEIWYNGFMKYRDNRWNQLESKSYAEAIDNFIEDWEWTDDESLQFINLIEDGIEIEYGGNSDNIDVHQVDFNEESYSIDSYFMSTPGQGFGNVAAKYAEPFRDKIRLNSRVTEVNSEMEEDGSVAVKYIDEDGNANLIKGAVALSTVSLGVMKAGVINFVPALPEKKQTVIDAMGFGVLNRCSMIWDNEDDMVWPIEPKWFIVMTPEDETSGIWTTFNNPTEIKGEPSLVSWVGGKEAIEAEKQTDDEILDNVMKNLRSMFPTIRKPDRFIIARWGLDENMYGAYSHPVPGRDIYDDGDVLQETYGKIFFAGEATGSGWATTMGAWKSGKQAADGMMDMLQSM